MRLDPRVLSAAGALLMLTAAAGAAFGQKSGGVLRVHAISMSDAEFEAALAKSIDEIYRASTEKV